MTAYVPLKNPRHRYSHRHSLMWNPHLTVFDSLSPIAACLVSVSPTYSPLPSWERQQFGFWLWPRRQEDSLWLDARLCAGIIVQSSQRAMVIIMGGWESCFLGHQNVSIGRDPVANRTAVFTPAFGQSPALLIPNVFEVYRHENSLIWSPLINLGKLLFVSLQFSRKALNCLLSFFQPSIKAGINNKTCQNRSACNGIHKQKVHK